MRYSPHARQRYNLDSVSQMKDSPLMRIFSGMICFMVLLSAALMPSAALGQTEILPRFEWTDCDFTTPVGVDVDCGDLIVLEDRRQPNGPTIRLSVAIFRADSPNPAPDPIIYLEGGPGGSGLMQMESAFSLAFDRFNDTRDFIVFDQRGTGYSRPNLACDELTDWMLDSIGIPLTDEENFTQSMQELAACRERLANEGVNLSAYTSAANAADLADLRVALGYKSWNLYGISYGTRLALTTLRDRPEGIRSVILDSAYPLEVNLFTSIGTNFDRALRVLFDSCAADPACAETYPDLEENFYTVADRLDAKPVAVQAFSLNSLGGQTVSINGADFMQLVFQSLYSVQLLPALPGLITDAMAGDFQIAAALMLALQESSGTVSTGMNMSVQCGEEIPFTLSSDLEAAIAATPHLEHFLDSGFSGITGLFDYCGLWDVSPAADIENEAVTSDIPTLVLAGQYDPVTPPEWGQQVAENLTHAYFVELPNVGHGVSVSAICGTDIAVNFLDDPTTPPDTTCTTTIAAPTFVAIAPDALTLIPFESDLFALQGVRPEEWIEAMSGTYAESAASQVALTHISLPGTIGMLESLLESMVIPSSKTPELREANGMTWQISNGEAGGMLAEAGQGLGILIAIAEGNGAAYAIILQAPEASLESYREAVFYPAVDALRPLR